MKNQKQIEKLIRSEWERAKDGDQYIFDGPDGMAFIGHLLFVMTNGEEGEKNECLAGRDLTD
jgi:hypothetical protein